MVRFLREPTMTTGNILYLAMSIGVFVLFSAILAHQSWQQSRGPRSAPRATQSQSQKTISA
jgi:hypothetical protein